MTATSENTIDNSAVADNDEVVNEDISSEPATNSTSVACDNESTTASLCKLEEGSKDAELEDVDFQGEDEEMVWVGVSNHSTSSVEFDDTNNEVVKLPQSMMDDEKRSDQSATSKRTVLRPLKPAAAAAKLETNISYPQQDSCHEDQFSFAWAPTWEEEEVEPPKLRASNSSDAAEQELEMCRIRLDEQYERALEDREVVFRARYASVCQSTCASAFVMLLYLAVGCTFYKSHTQWDITDSLLFTVYSVTTVGYGNHQIPKTVSFQLFTILYILVGIAFITILAAQIYEYFVLQATKFRHDEVISSRRQTTITTETAPVEDLSHSATMINTFRARFMAELHSQIIDGRPWAERVLDSTWHFLEKTKTFMSETSIGQMLSVFLPFCGLILFGALVVGCIEGWTAVESIYWAVVTLTTVGYGDYYPTKTSSTWFCIFYLPSSLFVMSLFLAHVASTYISFTAAQQVRMESRMRERIKRTRDAEQQASSSAAAKTASLANSNTNTTPMESNGDEGLSSPNRLTLFSLRKKATVAPTLGFETLPSGDEEGDETSSTKVLFGSPESEFFEQKRGLSRRDIVLQNSLYGLSPSPSRQQQKQPRSISKVGEKNMKAILESVKLNIKRHSSLDDFEPPGTTRDSNGSGTKPSFAVRMLVQERLAQIIATDIAGYHSGVMIKDNTLTVKIESLMRTMQKWHIPRAASRAFRSVSFHCLFFVGEHDLIVKGADALLELGPLEFNELFSPLLAAMGNRETMVKWLASTSVLADVELKRVTESDERESREMTRRRRELV